jgi:tRNA (guanine-N7-)-methyltransferase
VPPRGGDCTGRLPDLKRRRRCAIFVLMRSRITVEEALRLEALMRSFVHAEMEIGAGKGRFLIQRALENPGTLFVAVEIRRKYAGIMASRIRRRRLSNAVVLGDDIGSVLDGVLTGNCLFDRVLVSFPDPWWKRRHRGRYLVREEIVSGIVRVLRHGGELFVQTDVFERAKAVLRLLSDNPSLENTAQGGGFIETNPFGEQSSRELVCLELGLPVFRVLFRKV